MEQLVSKFISDEFERMELSVNTKALEDSMMMMLHSHRYNKGEIFTKDLDFSIIRGVLYRYSSDARSAFMNHEVYSFLYTYFTEQGGSKEFVRSKVQGKTSLYVLELEEEFLKLDMEA